MCVRVHAVSAWLPEDVLLVISAAAATADFELQFSQLCLLDLNEVRMFLPIKILVSAVIENHCHSSVQDSISHVLAMYVYDMICSILITHLSPPIGSYLLFLKCFTKKISSYHCMYMPVTAAEGFL
jgi:hypothetical protein